MPPFPDYAGRQNFLFVCGLDRILKHGFGNTASRAECVRAIFNGRDVTKEFHEFEAELASDTRQ